MKTILYAEKQWLLIELQIMEEMLVTQFRIGWRITLSRYNPNLDSPESWLHVYM